MKQTLSKILVVLTLGTALPAGAQSIDEATRLYKKREFKDAALAFYDVLSYEANPDTRDQAQVYLAESLRKMQLWVPALFYYTEIFKRGSAGNRYYLNALEGMLEIQEGWHDPIFVVTLLDQNYDADGFGSLNPNKIAQLNFLFGELYYRRGSNDQARAYFEVLPPESPYYPKARYVMGLLDVRAGQGEAALDHFRHIVNTIDEDTSDEEMARLRNLALIAAGRIAYTIQRYGDATKWYKQVPRLSEEWFYAMYENAWSHFQQQQYGKALGEVQSVTAPYFAKRHVPEAYVIAATTYFVNCQWDRVRREVGVFKKFYEPMRMQLEEYLTAPREPVEYYRDVVAGGNGKFSLDIARDVRRQRRFKDYHFMLTHLGWETDYAKGISEWQNSRLLEALAEVMSFQRDELEPAVGRWVKTQLQNRLSSLNNFQNQINILDFEVADAERKWLEQGKEILKGRRARLPRPEIPNDQWQHWSFDEEYWKDELGYIQHSLASECLDAGES